jgi:hypothetical protein
VKGDPVGAGEPEGTGVVVPPPVDESLGKKAPPPLEPAVRPSVPSERLRETAVPVRTSPERPALMIRPAVTVEE